jgi:putative zinc finger/helix-turn-helix YgiT family protein
MKKEVCQFCDSQRVEILESDTWDFPEGPANPAYQVHGITCFHCLDCDEKWVDPTMDKKNQPLINDALRKAKHLLTSEEIKEVLAALGLSETELESILGLGAKSFQRWKKGQIIQSPAADALLIAIQQHPDLIQVLAERRGISITHRKKGRPPASAAS